MDYMIEEYKTLRDEIISAKGRRLQTTSMTVGAMGVLLSVIASAVLDPNTFTPAIRFIAALAGGIAMYLILIPCQIMNISLQQTIQRIGDYIRTYIEPEIPGLEWETRWADHKKKHRLAHGARGISGIFLFLAFLPWLLPFFSFSYSQKALPLIAIFVFLFCVSIYLGLDMHNALSSGWKWNWTNTTSLPKKDEPS
jgi:hypothetical protein